MKNLLYILFIVLLSTSCEEELNLYPISEKTEASFYKTSDQLQQAVFACYDGLQGSEVNSRYSYMLSESRSDNTWQGTEYDDGAFTRFSENATLPVLAEAWNSIYNHIQRCNMVLESLDNVEGLEQDVKKQWEGEALFIRSLLYFDLVRYFGEVPLVTTTLSIDEAYKTPKATIKEVYDLIRDDLLKVVEDNLLSTNIVAGQANMYSAKALLGKVYVYRSGYPLNENEWTNAKTFLGDVIQSEKFQFLDNYADIFAFENENGNQSVFSIKFVDGTSEGNSFPSRNAPNEIQPSDFEFGGSPFRLFIKEQFVDQIFPEENDVRKDISLRRSWLNKTGVVVTQDPWCRKYAEYNNEINGPLSGVNNWNIDFILIRYTDILMLYAESLNELEGPNGEALEILNKVRNRAGLLPKSSTDKETYRLWMEQERRSEFCFENQRWFDLVRTDRALEVMQEFLSQQEGGFEANFTDRDKYYFPIPQSVTDLTGIK